MLDGLGDCALLVTPGLMPAVAAAMADRPNTRLHALPWLQQPDFDHLLWAADLNLVRGEDSFVRAQWAGAPFVWQIYPQHDDAHHLKLDAFLDKFLKGAPLEMSAGVRRFWRLWNGLDVGAGKGEDSRNAGSESSPLSMADWGAWCRCWREHLTSQADLTSQLVDFAAGRR
jgi:uncharacterized repeat protein (TIGR03837 family)